MTSSVAVTLPPIFSRHGRKSPLPRPGPIYSEEALASIAVALGARKIAGWSEAEESLAVTLPPASPSMVQTFWQSIKAGLDPLGAWFCALRSPEQRRPQGATYTPSVIVDAMVAWARERTCPDRIVDPGAGSGLFTLAAAKAFPKADLVAIEIDPLAAMLARANFAVHGLIDRSEVRLADYRDTPLREFDGRTLFIGNPPYVRHHTIGDRWKAWLTQTAAKRGLAASQLAGLHVHFFLATVEHAKPGDYGAFVTASEWLDVNYGELVRKLFLGDLGGLALHVIEPTALPFADAATTAAITMFQTAEHPASMRIKRVEQSKDLGTLDGGRLVRRERFEIASRWSPLTRAERKVPAGYYELGELCRVHRGQVTGDNDFWIAGPHAAALPDAVLFSSVTKARELYAAGRSLTDNSKLRKVIDLPEDLDVFTGADRKAITALLKLAQDAGVHQGYVASHRKAWWSVGLREPAPILATYMARRPPNFVRNISEARHINIAHGLYPREPMTDAALDALAEHLATHTTTADGRTYAGGLTKFEPKEMERLLVPGPELLCPN